MANSSNNSVTFLGAIGGALASIFGCIHTADMAKTIVLSVTGTVVSVLISLLMKKVLQRRSRPKQPQG